MIKDIITDVEQLSIRCDEIDIRKENDLMRSIILDLKETLREHKTGVGLSANQIGYSKRIFVINFNGEYRSFVNPIIVEVKGLTMNREACLSIPGKEYIRPRHNDITVMYQTPLGKTETKRFFGVAAYVFQHELDHLDGLLISDIGLEITEDFDKATEEERTEVLNMYLDSLDIKQKEIQKEIAEDKDLQDTDNAIKLMEAVQKGEVSIEYVEKKREEIKTENKE